MLGLRQKNSPPRKGLGLQIKSALLLGCLLLTTTLGGSWLYDNIARQALMNNDRRQADRLAGGLAVAAAPALLANDQRPLQAICSELLRHSDVCSASIIDQSGQVVASASSEVIAQRHLQRRRQPISLTYEDRAHDLLEVGRPVLSSDKQPQLIGAVRLVTDTQQTAALADRLRRETLLLAAIMIVCSIPLGYVLVSNLLVRPILHLRDQASQLAGGQLSARAQITWGGEIGQLAGAFNAMAQSVQTSQLQLREANESLEQKVAQRTDELQCSNARLREEMAEKEEFLRAVSHDLNAPLRNIAGMAGMILLKWRPLLPDDVPQRLERINANVQAETQLIDELLELSRIKTRPERREPLCLGSLLEQVRQSFDFELRSKRITLQTPDELPTLYVERNRLRQVFQNLIDNAIKYMGNRPDGRIEIGYRLGEDAHEFWVKDNGQGIAPEDQKRIFQVFRRAAASSGIPGKGVGLALVKSILANYGGRVWVDSHPGQGATFHFTLSASQTRLPAQLEAVSSKMEMRHAG